MCVCVCVSLVCMCVCSIVSFSICVFHPISSLSENIVHVSLCYHMQTYAKLKNINTACSFSYVGTLISKNYICLLIRVCEDRGQKIRKGVMRWRINFSISNTQKILIFRDKKQYYDDLTSNTWRRFTENSLRSFLWELGRRKTSYNQRAILAPSCYLWNLKDFLWSCWRQISQSRDIW